jgi:hypothetical protein
MINQFSAENYPDQVPAELASGARWAWTRSDITSAYPTSAYTLSFRLTQLDSPNVSSTITAAKTGSAHVVEVSADDTKGAYAAGDYSWQAIITRDSDGEQVQVDAGLVVITPDLAQPGVASSWVYQVLTAIRATLKNTASKEQAAYSIGGRSLSMRSIPELMEMEKEFADRWRRERQDAERKAGRAAGNRVLVKMSA